MLLIVTQKTLTLKTPKAKCDYAGNSTNSAVLHFQRAEQQGLWVIKRRVIVRSDGSLCGGLSEVRPPS